MILHGLEGPFDGPVSELLWSAATVTLLTFGGHEVLVGELEEIGQGKWVGKVVKAVDDPASPGLNEPVEFSEAQVHAATRKER